MKFLLCLIVVLSVFSCKEETSNNNEPEKSSPPNILFIMADDHAFQAISAYGHPISKLAPTPNIDRIAINGAIFNKNFCTNSICGPSRAVILTGKHSHINGFRMNGDKFNGDQQTFPKILQQGGYNTAMIGKWHLYGEPQGFDYWSILNDQGNYYNPDFITLNESAQKIDSTRIEGYSTDIITEKGIDFLKSVKDTGKPFLLMLQHKAPHRNWMPALRHLNKYDSIEFPLPDSYFTDHTGSQSSKDQLQTIYKDMYEGHDLKMSVKKGSTELAHNPWKTDFERMTKEQRAIWDSAYLPKNDAFYDLNLHGEELAKWKGQRYLHEYLSTIAAVDEGVGKVLDYLDENGLTDNTIVVYTSDQGFFLGEKGWFDKRYMYEESLRMPLLIMYPPKIKKGKVIEALTQNLDFAETFLDYAGLPIPKDMQGKSLRPLLEGKVNDQDFRNAIYYHYYDYPAFHMVKKMYGVRTDRYKLIHVYDDIDQWELYDLKSDPQELTNLYDSASYGDIQAKLKVTLDSLQKEYKVTDKEFEQADTEKVKNAYKQFEKLRGKPIE
ncbi:uncharacterized sulfatase [Flavobacteriaceae bacterium MAR_2010_188]|nr:uncharacterized sulfatase [Flavobacteriaceae bacterium MAR_2010_188]